MEDMTTKNVQLNVTVPEPLAIEAKKTAIDRRMTLKALAAEGLLLAIRQTKQTPDQPRQEFYD
jgi:hypothetical protein